MVVWIVWAVAVGVSLIILGVLGYGLYGHFTRLQRAVAAAQVELQPTIEALQAAAPQAPAGRHRAG